MKSQYNRIGLDEIPVGTRSREEELTLQVITLQNLVTVSNTTLDLLKKAYAEQAVELSRLRSFA